MRRDAADKPHPKSFSMYGEGLLNPLSTSGERVGSEVLSGLILIFLFLILLAGCGNSDDSKPTTTPEVVVAIETQTAAPQSRSDLNDCEAVPIEPTEIRLDPNRNAMLLGQLVPEAAGIVIAQNSAGWFQIEYASTFAEHGWIRSRDVELVGNCEIVPAISAVPESDCELVNRGDSDQAVYAEQSTEAALLLQMSPGDSFKLLRQHEDWYRVYVDSLAVQAWIPVQPALELSGECTVLNP